MQCHEGRQLEGAGVLRSAHVHGSSGGCVGCVSQHSTGSDLPSNSECFGRGGM